MSSPKPILLHGHPGPNPWKIALLLEELGVPYTMKIHTSPELKAPEFLALNRNGMAPVIEDPNTNILLAESGAIMDYLVDEYDKNNSISFTNIKERYHMKQWLQFQTTTQGPGLQQVFRWTFLEPNAVALTSDLKNFRRVLQVLDDELAEKEWLVGGHCSAADLSFVPFHSRIEFAMKKDAPNMEVEYPHADAWFKRMCQRPAVQKVLDDSLEALKRLSLPPPAAN